LVVKEKSLFIRVLGSDEGNTCSATEDIYSDIELDTLITMVDCHI
jgi:hypothetical protein